MAVYRSTLVRRLLDAWPGKKHLGLYRFLPIFFILGATVEFSMINWQVGETNFYRTFKRRKAEDIVEILKKEQSLKEKPFVITTRAT